VLDFGAGRGEWYEDDPVRYRRELQNFRGRCEHVEGCDIDDIVLQNPTVDSAAVFRPGEPLPYPDEAFDLIISRYVFEHVADPEWASSELRRILKPGGWICAVTPNKFGYVALAARLVPNRLHAFVLKKIQPHRKEKDVFPTVYLLNTPKAIRRNFGSWADVAYYRDSAVPSYHFGKPIVFRILQFVHWILPSFFGTGFFIFIRKRV
jgi:SAM-dependent methyltransferase